MTAMAASDERVDCVALCFALPHTVLAGLQAMLWLLSPNGIVVDDAMSLGGADLDDDWTRVTLYVAPQHADQAATEIGRQAASLGAAIEVAATEVLAQDWNKVWKQFFVPLMVADGRVRIEPAWMQGPDQPGVVRIAIDPGMAFGTGTHETTQLCMAEVVHWADQQRALGSDIAQLAVLDVGGGSAILATLAIKLGVGRAVCTEIDAAALGTAAINLTLNGVSDRITLLHTGDPGHAGPQRFGLVLANILATVLLPLRDAIAARAAPGGTLVLSGILVPQAQEVADHYAALGLQCQRITQAGAWAAVVLQVAE